MLEFDFSSFFGSVEAFLIGLSVSPIILGAGAFVLSVFFAATNSVRLLTLLAFSAFCLWVNYHFHQGDLVNASMILLFGLVVYTAAGILWSRFS